MKEEIVRREMMQKLLRGMAPGFGVDARATGAVEVPKPNRLRVADWALDERAWVALRDGLADHAQYGINACGMSFAVMTGLEKRWRPGGSTPSTAKVIGLVAEAVLSLELVRARAWSRHDAALLEACDAVAAGELGVALGKVRGELEKIRAEALPSERRRVVLYVRGPEEWVSLHGHGHYADVRTDLRGVVIWEGVHVEVVDAFGEKLIGPVGDYRKPTDAEWNAIDAGVSPFDDVPKDRERPQDPLEVAKIDEASPGFVEVRSAIAQALEMQKNGGGRGGACR